MNILHTGYRTIVQGLQRFQQHPPAPPKLETAHVESAQLLVDRLNLLRKLPRGGRAMECGVDEGKFSRQILEIAQPEELILVDLWSTNRFNESKLQQIQQEFSSELSSGQVRIERMTSVQALRQVPDGSLDWVYIDTDHSYATTREELHLAAQKVKPDGYICGHDYAVGFWGSYIRYGVIEAVNRFCVEQGWRFAYLSHEPDQHASFALSRLERSR